VIAHGVTLESCTRQLIGEAKRSLMDLRRVLQGVPYCAVAFAEENAGKWSLIPQPNFCLKHSPVHDFDSHATLTATINGSNGTV